ncbi:hypothetical protein YC2023_012105 [Brassica napus]
MKNRNKPYRRLLIKRKKKRILFRLLLTGKEEGELITLWIKLVVKLPMLHSVTVPTGKLIRDEELGAISDDDDDSPSGKRSKLDRFLLSRCELAVSLGVFLVFSSGLFCIYITMPAAESGKLKLPKKHL